MKKIVIVVDDSEMIRNMMTKALEDEYTVIQAVDGRDAIDKMTQYNSIACMLLDLSMPVYDGFMVLDYFKANHLFSKVPVFIISGDDSKKTIQRAFTYPIVDMLNKPFSFDKIKDAVQRAIIIGNQ